MACAAPPRGSFYVLAGMSVALIVFAYVMVFVTPASVGLLTTWTSMISLAYGLWMPSIRETHKRDGAARADAVAAGAPVAPVALDAGALDASPLDDRNVVAHVSTTTTTTKSVTVAPPTSRACCGLVAPAPRPRFYVAAGIGALVLAGAVARISQIVAGGVDDGSKTEITAWVLIMVTVFNSWTGTVKDTKKALAAAEDGAPADDAAADADAADEAALAV